MKGAVDQTGMALGMSVRMYNTYRPNMTHTGSEALGQVFTFNRRFYHRLHGDQERRTATRLAEEDAGLYRRGYGSLQGMRASFAAQREPRVPRGVFLQRGASPNCEKVTLVSLQRTRAFAGALVVINPV
jgi:hypothetical protein